MPKGIPKKLKPFENALKDKVITSAAKIAQRKSRPKTEADNMELSAKQEADRNRVHNALRYGMEMTEQQFLNAVQKNCNTWSPTPSTISMIPSKKYHPKIKPMP